VTVAEALRVIDAREARLLLASVTGFSEASLLSSMERALAPDVSDEFIKRAERRKKGEPIAYIVGSKEFYSLELSVNPAVLIPRPETELLVDLALERRPATVLDLGTGSGAIALAIKKHLPSARVCAVEASAAALAVARRNAVKHNLAVDFVHARWFEGVGDRRFDVIVSNPPYVAAGDPHLKDLGYEPQSALVSGADGLDAIREIAPQAPRHLAPGGWLLLEHGIGQDGKVRSLLGTAGLESVTSWPDLAGIPRVCGASFRSGVK
jgi:release factor glutamine methyltransferase